MFVMFWRWELSEEKRAILIQRWTAFSVDIQPSNVSQPPIIARLLATTPHPAPRLFARSQSLKVETGKLERWLVCESSSEYCLHVSSCLVVGDEGWRKNSKVRIDPLEADRVTEVSAPHPLFLAYGASPFRTHHYHLHQSPCNPPSIPFGRYRDRLHFTSSRCIADYRNGINALKEPASPLQEFATVFVLLEWYLIFCCLHRVIHQRYTQSLLDKRTPRWGQLSEVSQKHLLRANPFFLGLCGTLGRGMVRAYSREV